MSYCGNCGTKINEGQSFCASCGASVSGDLSAAEHSATVRVAVQPSSDAMLQRLATLKAQTPPPAKSSGKTILIAVLAVILLGGIAVVGGLAYIGYRVKRRATAAFDKLDGGGEGPSENKQTASSSGDGDRSHSGGSNNESKPDGSDSPLSSVLGKLQGGDSSSPMGNMAKSILGDLGAKNPDMPPDLARSIPKSALTNPPTCPTASGTSDAEFRAGKIPIIPGTSFVGAWTRATGDLEDIDQVQSIDPLALIIQHDGEVISSADQAHGPRKTGEVDSCRLDLERAETYELDLPFPFPKVVRGVSRIVFPIGKMHELGSSGSTVLTHVEYHYQDALSEWEAWVWKGEMKRVEAADVEFPLIVNDQHVELPAIHIKGLLKVIENGGQLQVEDAPAEAYILDDPSTPVVLSWKDGRDYGGNQRGVHWQLIKVSYPVPGKPTIEQQLVKQHKVITYGIYFDFNRDTIKPESEPVLKEIAQAMADNPDWKLAVTGHTDNIGGHNYNLDLSQRRSAAVKKALVERYHVAPNRLSSSGAGDSAPIDTNDTLEGRARNRRVELTLD